MTLSCLCVITLAVQYNRQKGLEKSTSSGGCTSEIKAYKKKELKHISAIVPPKVASKKTCS